MGNLNTSSAAKRYGKSLLLGGLMAIFANVFFLGTPELASGIRNGGAILVVAGLLIWLFGHALSKRT